MNGVFGRPETTFFGKKNVGQGDHYSVLPQSRPQSHLVTVTPLCEQKKDRQCIFLEIFCKEGVGVCSCVSQLSLHNGWNLDKQKSARLLGKASRATQTLRAHTIM